MLFGSANWLTSEELKWVIYQLLNGDFFDGKITADVGD
jgi:hypothetical protein